MKEKKKTKRVLSCLLASVLMLSVTPQIIFANSNISDRYEEANSVRAIVNDAEVHVYVTQKGGTVNLTGSNKVETTFPQGSGYREYKAIPANGWRWKGWTYEQFYQGDDLRNRTDLGGKRYSFSNSGSDWETAYNGTGQTISVNRLFTTGETIGNKITYNLYANFNPTINATAEEGGTITDSGITEVEYGGNKTYTIAAETGKEIASVLVDGQAISGAAGKDSLSYDFKNVREPHTINVAFVKKASVINQIPVINAEDKTITVGDTFDPMKDVTASDKENGDLTTEIKIISNNVDTSKAGTYTVIYEVTDYNGASTTKTITVTVKDKEDVTECQVKVFYDANGGTGTMEPITGDVGSKIVIEQNGFARSGYTFTGWNTQADGKGTAYKAGDSFTLTDKDTVLYAQWGKNSGSAGTDKSTTLPQTGDNSNLAFWIVLLLVSGSAVIGTAVVSKKKKYNR